MNEDAKFRLGAVITLWFSVFIGLYLLFSPNLPDLRFGHKCRALDYNSLKCDRASDRAEANKITEERLARLARANTALERASKLDPGLLNYGLDIFGNASVIVTNDSGFKQTFILGRICEKINNQKIIEDGGGHYIRYTENNISIKEVADRYTEATEVIDNCIISHPQITLGRGENVSNIEDAVENSEIYTFRLRMDNFSLFILFVISVILCRYILGIFVYFREFIFKKTS